MVLQVRLLFVIDLYRGKLHGRIALERVSCYSPFAIPYNSHSVHPFNKLSSTE